MAWSRGFVMDASTPPCFGWKQVSHNVLVAMLLLQSYLVCLICHFLPSEFQYGMNIQFLCRKRTGKCLLLPTASRLLHYMHEVITFMLLNLLLLSRLNILVKVLITRL